jgi:hypothetical protein
MHVVWKRPDGFHGASPADFKVVELPGHSRIWLHKSDTEWFPFRISGGWQDEDATKKLNTLVNLIGRPSADWLRLLEDQNAHSRAVDAAAFYKETAIWLSELKNNLKGDTWEIEIMSEAISEVERGLQGCKQDFLSDEES